ncbi:MAG: hypothetical protein IJS09_08185 [Treponema sp.]|nr:hypothetical protein [Treponema sp.]
MKKIGLVLMLFAAVSFGTAFAEKSDEIGMYVRGSLGYGYWSDNKGLSHFTIEPVFGVTNLFPVEGLGLEGFVDCNFGGKDYGIEDISSKVFAPGVRALYARSIGSFTGDTGVLSQIVPYAGAGFCVPIMHMSTELRFFGANTSISSTEVYFATDFVTGCAFTFNEKFAAHSEFALRIGSIFDFAFRIGGAFKFE